MFSPFPFTEINVCVYVCMYASRSGTTYYDWRSINNILMMIKMSDM